jgi:hypothetical protein
MLVFFLHRTQSWLQYNEVLERKNSDTKMKRGKEKGVGEDEKKEEEDEHREVEEAGGQRTHKHSNEEQKRKVDRMTEREEKEGGFGGEGLVVRYLESQHRVFFSP